MPKLIILKVAFKISTPKRYGHRIFTSNPGGTVLLRLFGKFVSANTSLYTEFKNLIDYIVCVLDRSVSVVLGSP